MFWATEKKGHVLEWKKKKKATSMIEGAFTIWYFMNMIYQKLL